MRTVSTNWSVESKAAGPATEAGTPPTGGVGRSRHRLKLESEGGIPLQRDGSAAGRSPRPAARVTRCPGLTLTIVCCLLTAPLAGCESLQRKFTRKPKGPQATPTPVINFQDYSRALTPMDQYRKHFLLFEYWNDELIRGLQARPLNSKQYRHASAESRSELETMQGLLADEPAARLAPLMAERAKLDQKLQGPVFSEMQAGTVRGTAESQGRRIHREFFWRDVEDRLKPKAVRAAPEPAPTP